MGLGLKLRFWFPRNWASFGPFAINTLKFPQGKSPCMLMSSLASRGSRISVLVAACLEASKGRDVSNEFCEMKKHGLFVIALAW